MANMLSGDGRGEAGVSHLRTTAINESRDLRTLNQQLAVFISNMRSSVTNDRKNDVTGYLECIKRLENEINKLTCRYEEELAKLRRNLEDVCKENAITKSALAQQTNATAEAINKLKVECENVRRLADAVRNLENCVKQKDRELSDAKTCIADLQRQLQQFAQENSMICQEKQRLNAMLHGESKRRQDAEDRLQKALSDNNLLRQTSARQIRELEDRLRAATDLVRCLERKIQELNGRPSADIGQLLQKLRESNVADLKRLQQDTENILCSALAGIKRQIDTDENERRVLEKQKVCLEETIRTCQSKYNEQMGQNEALKRDNCQLRNAVETERVNATNRLRQLESKLKNLQTQLLKDCQDFKVARDAQAALQVEIENYKNVLATALEEQQRQAKNEICSTNRSPEELCESVFRRINENRGAISNGGAYMAPIQINPHAGLPPIYNISNTTSTGVSLQKKCARLSCPKCSGQIVRSTSPCAFA